MRLWIDDLRPAPDSTWTVATTSAQAIAELTAAKAAGTVVERISFDHDLGGDDNTRKVVIWIIENDFWPEQCLVHTANPVGREWLVGMIDRYG